MKEIIQRRLTSNAEINKHILAKFDLQDNVKHGSTLLEEIKRAFLSEEITREEMDMIFYDVYHIDEIFDDRMFPYHVAILAELGYIHDKIVEASTNIDALHEILMQYKYLETLMNHPTEIVRFHAKERYNDLNQVRAKHSSLLKLLDTLDLTLFYLKEFDQNFVIVEAKSLIYEKNTFNFDVHVKVIDCGKSFSIDLLYDMYPETRCRRAEQFFNEYPFKKLYRVQGYPDMKHGKIIGLSFEEVLEFIDRESHMEY